MLPIPHSEVQSRVKTHLDLRYKERRHEKLSRLLLEALVDELRIYRIRCEVEQDKSRATNRSKRHPGRDPRDKERSSSRGRHAEMSDRTSSPADASSDRHRSREAQNRTPTPAMTPGSAPLESLHSLSAALPQGNPVEKRRRRSLSMGPAPKYKPRLGWTMGWGTHFINCVKYVAEEKAKEKRSAERQELRRKKYEAKGGRDKDLEFCDTESRGADRHRGRTSFKAPDAGDVPRSSDARDSEVEAPNAWSCPPSRPAYHQNSNSQSAECREREQSGRESTEKDVGQGGNNDREYKAGPTSAWFSNN